MKRERGFALLIVLWSLVLITLLTTQILASGRTALNLAGNLRAAAQARALADGAINAAVFHLLAPGEQHWQTDAQWHILAHGQITLAVCASSLDGKINPNLASTKLLAGLLQALGSPPEQALQLAQGIIEWRSPAQSKAANKARLAAYQRAGLAYGPPGRNFADLSELGYVMGMPPALLAQAIPHLSLYQEGDPDRALADPEVRRALVLSGQTGANANVYEGTSPVVSIIAELDGPGNLAVRRYAMIIIGGPSAQPPFQVLALSDDQIETGAGGASNVCAEPISSTP